MNLYLIRESQAHLIMTFDSLTFWYWKAICEVKYLLKINRGQTKMLTFKVMDSSIVESLISIAL